jgi:branched-chain amino acid transport system substrate-binding protein
MQRRDLGRLAVAAFGSLCLPATAQPRPVLIGIDAEFGHLTSTSAEAIRRGAEVAIDEINRAGGVLGGRMLALEIRDNRSVPARSVVNVQELAALPNVVAVIGGKFSPAVSESAKVAQQAGLPLLAAWSAADEIIDARPQPSFVFRLSLRDSWALPAMMRHAQSRGWKRLGLVVPNTSWGRSSVAAAERFESQSRVKLVAIEWYNWGDKSLHDPYDRLRRAGADALVLVANETEGAILINEVAALPAAERLPMVSHWGVTGGRFHEATGQNLRALDFSVVQTYSFIGARDPVARRVLARLGERYGVVKPEAVEAPVGVAHAYDLVQILARAIDLAGSTDRAALRDALERVRDVQGLVRHYAQPFTPQRHEALDPSVVFLARYDDAGALQRLR